MLLLRFLKNPPKNVMLNEFYFHDKALKILLLLKTLFYNSLNQLNKSLL